MRTVLAIAGLAGCTGDASSILVYDYVGDGDHALAAVPLGVITDPTRMRTELGPAARGGRIAYRGDAAVMVPGADVRVGHVVKDGVFVPTDEEGLVLASFFHHLEVARDELDAASLGEPLDRLFPLDAVLWNPAIGADIATVENAAFLGLPDSASFVLFPDANSNVPLGAHAGVVRHELGHGYLSRTIPTFDPAREDEVFSTGLIDGYHHRALHEGFADIFSTLSLDDPEAIPFGDLRDPRVVHPLSEAYLGDPYSLGVVLASFAWSARVTVGDADAVLDVAIAALEDWEARLNAGFLSAPAADYGVDLLNALIARWPEHEDAFCDDFALRFEFDACS